MPENYINMSQVVYIKVPTHIRQWAYHAYGNPVVFPVIGNEVAVLRRFTSKPPMAKLTPVDEENVTETQKATAANLHQSVVHTFKDEEFEQSRWLTHPDDYMAIELPESKAKPVREFNYLGPRARRAVKEMVTDLFKIDLWASLKDIADRSCRLSSLISAWCEQHGIGIDYEDTVRQCFYRMREQHAKRGVNLTSTTRFSKD